MPRLTLGPRVPSGVFKNTVDKVSALPISRSWNGQAPQKGLASHGIKCAILSH